MRPGALCAYRLLLHDVPQGVTAPTTWLLLVDPLREAMLTFTARAVICPGTLVVH